jgi:membrane-bound lytic murein transglycosylase D
MIYLAVAESGFNPRALNGKSGAGGMWQFMPHGNYGLKRNAYVDERFDPEKSTRAAARYMKFIYDQLGDWYLAMAGYNWGTGNVQRAVQKTGYGDFWELYKRHNLPAETQNYVPEILAAIIIANNPTQYGFDEITLDAPVLTDTVTINYQVDLHLVSDIVGAPMTEMTALNPSLLRSITPPDTSFDLHLPAGTAALFEKQIALIPEDRRNAWRLHRVKPGDTLASVAKEHRIGVTELAAANQKQESDSLDGVETLVVPSTYTAPAPSSSSAASASTASHAATYTVHKGETLVTIADRFGVSLDQLRRWNKIKGSGVKIKAGRRLYVAETGSSSRAASSSDSTRDTSTGGRHKRGSKTKTRESSEERESSTTRETGTQHESRETRETRESSAQRESSTQEESKAKSSSGKGKRGRSANRKEKDRSSSSRKTREESSKPTSETKKEESSKPASDAKKSDSEKTGRHAATKGAAKGGGKSKSSSRRRK